MQECVYWKAVMDIDELEERLTKTRPRSSGIIDQAIDLWRDRINATVRTQRQTLPNTRRDALLRDVDQPVANFKAVCPVAISMCYITLQIFLRWPK